MTVDKVLCWNAKVNRPAGDVVDGLAQLIEDAGSPAQVICLQEAGGYIDAIRKRFDPDWYTYAKQGWDESRMCPVMVARKGREQLKYNNGWGVVRTTTKWVGPQGGSHTGRTWTWALVDGVYVMSLHRCTDGDGKNQAAFKEEGSALTKWIDGLSKPSLVLGDHNCGVGKTYAGASKTVATNTGGKLTADPDESGIDYAITGAGLKATLNRRGKTYGSDHAPVAWHRS